MRATATQIGQPEPWRGWACLALLTALAAMLAHALR